MKRESKEAVLMTAEEKAQFEAFQKEQARKAAMELAKENRDTYRGMVNDEVLNAIPLLRGVSKNLIETKQKVFRDFQTVLDMKSDVMKLTKDNQRTHTFSDSEGKYRLILGTYMLDGYDDTVESGIAIVKEYISSLAGDDPKARSLVNMVLKLLAKDAAGNLKASRVLQLRKLADESGNDRFIEGVRIIEESYRPTPSKTFLRAEERDAIGGWKSIPLGMTES
jgi:hypothetical protein